MIKGLVIAIILAATSFACNKQVPAGHIGRVQSPEGFKPDILAPGYHPCNGRDVMYLMETTDVNMQIEMDVLCKDSLKFKFVIDMLVSVDTSKADLIKKAFQDLKPAVVQEPGEVLVITNEQLFLTYIRANAAQAAQRTISKYETRDIVNQGSEIVAEVQAAVILSSQHSFVRVTNVAITNLDFPKVIEDAQEARAKRMVEIETAKADAEVESAKAQSKLALAEIMAKQKLLEAAAVADANKIIASSISPNYLAWEQIQALVKASENKNSVFLYPYQDTMNKQIGTSTWVDPEKLLDVEVRKKLEDARRDAGKASPIPEVPTVE